MLITSVKSLGKGKLKHVISEINAIKQIHARVGFIDGATYPDGTKVAYVAYLNEFGDSNNPRRPFLAKTFKENNKRWIKGIAVTMKRGGLTKAAAKKAFEAAALVAVGDVKETIKQWNPNDPCPNSPATIKAKAERARKSKGLEAINPNTVLIDTGVMIRAVDYEVKQK